MKFKVSKKFNEGLIGNCNMGVPEKEIPYTAAVSATYANAVNDHQKLKKKFEDDMTKQTKDTKEFVKMNHNREVKGQTTKEMKNMKLTEAADFGDPTSMGRCACAPLAPDFTRLIRDYVKHLNDNDSRDFCIRSLKGFAESLYGAMGEQQAFNNYWTARYPAVMKYIEDQLAMIPSEILDDAMMKPIHEDIDVDAAICWYCDSGTADEEAGEYCPENPDDWDAGNPDFVERAVSWYETSPYYDDDDDDTEDLEEFLDASINVPVTATVTANGNNVPFMNGGVGLGEDVENDPHFFAEETLNEAPVATEPKKRARAENEVKYQRDYSSEDLWLAVYDELSSDLDNEGAGQQVDKQLKAKRGERYENVYPHGDSDIIIYATKPEEFEFAKRVADHYGVKYREPKQDTNPATNGHYKWSMVIEIPEDELFDAAFKPLHKDDEF